MDSIKEYSIKEVAELTGLTTSVLRVWESRYKWPRAKRQPNGYRIYHPIDIEEIRRVKLQLANGRHIGELIDDDGFLRHWNLAAQPVRSRPPTMAIQQIPGTYRLHPNGLGMWNALLTAAQTSDDATVLQIVHRATTLHPWDRFIILAGAFLYATDYGGDLRGPEMGEIVTAINVAAGRDTAKVHELVHTAWDACVKAGSVVIPDSEAAEASASHSKTG